MNQVYRTVSGGRIRRDQPIRFSFDGRTYTGYAGDTLASALLAHGVHLIGRSFKYHRPRGILSAGAEEPNALFTIDRGDGRTTPNQRATTIELYEGLTARSQNAWPSVTFDVGAIAGFLSPLLSAGFYYKTFMWPAAFWHGLYEPAIRAAAGLGRAPLAPDPDRYLHRYAHCDVLVIGAGPAGLAAAAAAAANRQRVILCDEQAEPGGSLLSCPDTRIDGLATGDWIAAALSSDVTVLSRTTAFGWYPDNMVALAEQVTDHLARPNPNLPRERLWLVRAGRVVIATGAIERPSVFPGNDRPGIMLAGAAGVYLHRYGVIPGRRIVVSTSHDSAWSTAFALAAAGTTVASILDQRDTVDPALRDQARAAGIAVNLGTRIIRTGGRRRVRFVQTDRGPAVIPCDTVLMSDGWTPAVQLFSQSRGKLQFDPDSGTFLPGQSAAAEQSIGACAGVFDLSACVAAGRLAGGGSSRTPTVTDEPRFGTGLPPTPGQGHSKSFVDFQNDVTTKDLSMAASEGFHAIEHVKRYTTAGMATDQGKTGNLTALATIAALTGRTMPEIGLTTFRPPYTPVSFGTFAGAARGALFEPVRRTPIDDQEAAFEDVGNWKRAHYFPRPGETMAQAVARECHAVRTDLGMFDASTLGKIEVAGPDAAEFLNRMYTGEFSRLVPGRCKYGLVLGEDGFIRDDGVIARLAPDRFHLTTTTGGAADVLHHMEDYLQTEFSSLRVWLTSITEQWAVIALQGPRAATALAPFLDGIDLTMMPHMSVREGRFAGVPTRLFRVSFTGEPGFEINLPASFARSAWDMLLATGATRYGTETMHVLRAEKGFIVVGQETDGTVIPDDLGLNRTIARSKPDFVGKRSLQRPDMLRADRKQLVGLLTADPTIVLEEGAQLTATGAVSLGHVTSAYYSATLGRSIALGLLAGGRSRIGAKLLVPQTGRTVEVTVTDAIFYDPAGGRMTCAIAQGAAQSAPSLVAARFTPPPTAFCAEVAVAMAPAAGKFSIRTQESVAAPLSAITREGATALWLGPDEYLVLGDAPPPIAAHAVVDVSDRTVAIRVSGPKAAWCLNAFCGLDLEAVPPDFCTRTLFGKAEIVLWHIGAGTFHIETARSYAPYVWELLETARREFLPPAAPC